ncbi:MAG: DNA ligase, partial [Cycloclasticus sp.]|nr:DNA ligase [Cycloclasticus sp.]
MKKWNFFILLTVVSLSAFAAKPDLFLLKKYHPDAHVIGWVMSEKLDGVRGYWDGENLISRGGKVLNPPAWFTEGYPPFPIDGELWTKRADF